MSQASLQKRKQRARLLRLHRWLGAAIGFYIILFALTGVLINHSHRLGLDKQPLQSHLLLSVYGVRLPTVSHGFLVDSRWVSWVADTAYLDTQPLGPCPAPLKAAASNGEWLLLQCDNALILLTASGELIEQNTTQPESIKSLAWVHSRFLAQGEHRLWEIDPNSMNWLPVVDTPNDGVQWASLQPLPMTLQQRLQSFNHVPDLTWERLLLDLHSGSLWGPWGVVIADIAAIGLMMLALSGMWAWWTRR